MLKDKKKNWYGFIVLCLIPLIGAFIGIILIILGLFKYKSKIPILIGILGLVCTAIFYNFIFDTLKHGKISDHCFSIIAKRNLNNVVDDIELYKKKYGIYPDSLVQLTEANGLLLINDPMITRKLTNEPSNLHFLKKDSIYFLFSVGVDGVPYTHDDIYPNILDSTKTGWRKH